MSSVRIIQASEADAEGISFVFEQIARERIHSAIDTPFTVQEERDYIQSLTPREAIYVAVTDRGIVGVQTLELWARHIRSMGHVGQIGTFLLPEWRGQGIGRELFKNTTSFARTAEYAKFIIQVRASNRSAQSFYRRLGFTQCGLLKHQVRIDETCDDEILMELFL